MLIVVYCWSTSQASYALIATVGLSVIHLLSIPWYKHSPAITVINKF